MLSFFTEHARTRMQQRGQQRLRAGLLRQAARARLFRDNPEAAKEAERLYRTGRNGVVVTVGHGYRPVPHG